MGVELTQAEKDMFLVQAKKNTFKQRLFFLSFYTFYHWFIYGAAALVMWSLGAEPLTAARWALGPMVIGGICYVALFACLQVFAHLLLLSSIHAVEVSMGTKTNK